MNLNFTLLRLIPVYYVPSIPSFLVLYRVLCTECLWRRATLLYVRLLMFNMTWSSWIITNEIKIILKPVFWLKFCPKELNTDARNLYKDHGSIFLLHLLVLMS